MIVCDVPLKRGTMATGHEILSELIIDLIIPPVLTALWLAFARVNNYMVDQKGNGSKIEPHRWRNLIQMYLVVLLLTLVHFQAR
jgi:hypothetical protein